MFAVVPLLLAGCASQGPLRPPSLHLPSQVQYLQAERTGNGVDLQWISPNRTTDGLLLTGNHASAHLLAEICRAETGRSACQPLGRVQAVAGQPQHFHDTLPVALATGSPHELFYRVRTLNADGKGAGFSTVEALAGAAPPTMENLRAAPAGNGVLVRWQPVEGDATERVLLRVIRGAAATEPPKTAAVPVLLAVELVTQDPGGAVDTGAKPGMAQHYSIVRARTIHMGTQDLVMSGEPAMVSVAADAKLPSIASPTGLAAVTNTLGAPEIDLVWLPSEYATGYLLFRSEDTGQPVELTAKPLSGLTYTDKAVKPGGRYRYSLAAVGSDGAAGPLSNEVTEQVPDR